MARGIQGMYLNLIRSSDALDPVFQRRVHQVARRKKDEELAAALARRADTIAEVDDDLSNWGSAKVQAAWFARPGRDMSAVKQRLRKEKRVTILEVVAAVENLDPSIYEICTVRNSTRVALPLVMNETAPLKYRLAAARTLAESFDSLSYRRQHELVGAAVACGPEVANALVKGCTDLETANRFVGVINALDDDSAEHVHALCIKVLDRMPKLHSEKFAESQRNNGRYYGGQYEVSRPLTVVVEATKFVAILTDKSSSTRDRLYEIAQSLVELFEKKQWSYDDEFRAKALDIMSNLTGSHVRGKPGFDAVKHASSSEKLLAVVSNLEKQDALDRTTAVAALCSPYATAAVAAIASESFGWGEIDRVLDAKNRELTPPVKAALLARSYDLSDRKIERYSINTTPHELWVEVVYAVLRDRTELPEQLMSSSYARVDVIPNLPIKVFSQPNTPGWLITGFSEYLASQLHTEEAWDAFEVLAPNHLGSVGQLLKACRLSTKHMTKEGA